MKILLATTNPHKIQEIVRIIPGVTFLGIHDFVSDWVIEETGNSFEENSWMKAKAAAHYFGMVAIADDSGLEIAVLDNFPGIHSARYQVENTYHEKMKTLLQKMAAYPEESQRYAQFRTVATFYDPLTGTGFMEEGKVEGSIATEISGLQGFGYDPIFIPKGFTQTFGQLPDEVKNSFSHRARAFKQLFERIKKEGYV